MQIASHVLAYNVNFTLKEVIENMSPHVDKIFIAHPIRPWSSNLKSRNSKLNSTTEEFIKNCIRGCNAEIVKGDWEFDEDARNECFNLAKHEGFDWFLTQDADEFYTDEGWEIIKKNLLNLIKKDFCITTWYNFWKNSDFIVEDNSFGKLKGANANFALKCKNSIYFEIIRSPNLRNPEVIDAPCYHYGYVMDDISMKEKIETWSHTNDFDTNIWYKLKWENWNLNTKNLHPTNPPSWKRALEFPFKQPEFSKKFKLNLKIKNLSLINKLHNTIYDFNSNAKANLRKIKKFIIK